MINYNIKSSEKNIHWINYVRAICIIAIYYIHAQEYFGYSIPGLAKYILPFYVNAFFFISGYLLFKKQMENIKNGKFDSGKKQFLENLLFRLIIPSIIFSIIEYIPSSIIQNREITILSFIEKTIWGRTFWFISALVVSELIIFALLHSKITSMAFHFGVSFALFLLGILIAHREPLFSRLFESNPWEIEKGLMATLFITLGGVFQKYEEKIASVLKSKGTIIILILYIGIVYIFRGKAHVLISMNKINILGVIESLLAIICLVSLCKAINGDNCIIRELDKIGKNTIGFYFVCGAIPKVLQITLPKFLPGNNLAFMLFAFVLSFALSYFAVFFMKRYLPFLFDLRLVKSQKVKKND